MTLKMDNCDIKADILRYKKKTIKTKSQNWDRKSKMTLKHDYDKDIYNYEYIDEIIRNKKETKNLQNYKMFKSWDTKR